jgi:hypothetical protein
MHRDVGVCSIGYDELIAVLLLRQQRGHAVQPAPGLWNGRRLSRRPGGSSRRGDRGSVERGSATWVGSVGGGGPVVREGVIPEGLF